MEQDSQFRCRATARQDQWLYQIGEEAILYSQSQNRIAGLDTPALLAFQAFEAGAALDDLQSSSTSEAVLRSLESVYELSNGRYPGPENRRRAWPLLANPPAASVQVHGIPLRIECLCEGDNTLCHDSLLSAPHAFQSARFHIRVEDEGSTRSIRVNGFKTFAGLKESQIGLGVLHTVRSILYEETFYDVALHAAMVACAGQGIVLCAPREHGKTTLAAHLVAHGYDLVSDEPSMFCVEEFSVAPVEMPMSLKRGAWDLLASDWPQLFDAPVHVRSDGWSIKMLHPGRERFAHRPQQPTHIVFPAYSPIATAHVERLSGIRILTLLSEGGLLFGKHMTKSRFEKFLTWILSMPGFAIQYSSLQEARELLREIIA